MRLDCDDLKRGLASKAHSYAEVLLTRLAEDHRNENKRFVFFLLSPVINNPKLALHYA